MYGHFKLAHMKKEEEEEEEKEKKTGFGHLTIFWMSFAPL